MEVFKYFYGILSWKIYNENYNIIEHENGQKKGDTGWEGNSCQNQIDG